MIDTTEIWLQERSREEALAERQLQRTPALLPPKPTILTRARVSCFGFFAHAAL